MNGAAFPTDPAQVDPAWLTEVLRRAGHDVTVAAVEAERIGTGQMAHNERFRLRFDGDAGTAPTTVVGKFPSTDPLSRAAGAMGGYEREVRFYRELAPTLDVAVPGCLHAELGDDNTEFVLVLEDLAPAEQGDQIAGCSRAQAEVAVENLAGLHAPRWDDPVLLELSWATQRSEDGVAFLGQLFRPDAAGFVERYRDRLSVDDADVLLRFAQVIEAWTMGRLHPIGPVHGDYRLDNLLFATAAGGRPVAAVDWQTLAVDLPVKDLAYFCGNSLLPDERRACEWHLVERYHVALVDRGVTGYSLEQCWDDYRYAAFHGLVITVLGAMHVVQTDRGDDMFMAMVSRHCQAIRDLDAETLLPAG